MLAPRLLAFLLASTFPLAPGRPSPAPLAEQPSPVEADREQARMVAEALDVIDLTYIKEIDTRVLLEAALRGMWRTADPAGGAVDPEIQNALKKARSAKRPSEQLQLLAEVLTHLRARHGAAVDLERAVQAGIQGMLETLDPKSSVVRADASRDRPVASTGLAVRKEGDLKVTASYDDMPAARARIRAGDRILRIDGQPTKDMTLEEALRRLRGPEGSRVGLSVVRGEREPVDVTLTREVTPPAIVKASDLGHGISYIRLGDFTESTPKQLRSALTDLERKATSALVVDLRDNPGGLLSSAIEVAGLFLKKGQLVASTTGRWKRDRARYEAEGESPLRQVPMSLLVNQGSASGTELVAAALQHWKRAAVVGARTSGTDSIQTIIPLRQSGFVLILTTGRFLTPGGLGIDGTGITPDVVVEAPDTEYAISSGEDGLSAAGPRFGDLDSDVQLQRAIELLRADIRN